MKMRVCLLVSLSLVRVFLFGALIGQETTLSHLFIQIMAQIECQHIQLY